MPERTIDIEQILGKRPEAKEKPQGPYPPPGDIINILGPRPATKMEKFLEPTEQVLKVEEEKARKIQEARVPLTKLVKEPTDVKDVKGHAIYGFASLGEGLLSAENAFLMVTMAAGPKMLATIGEAAFTTMMTYTGVKEADRAMQEFAAGRPGPGTAAAIQGLGLLFFAKSAAKPLSKNIKWARGKIKDLFKKRLREKEPTLPDDVVDGLGEIFGQQAEATRLRVKGLLRESQVRGQLQAPRADHLLPAPPIPEPRFPGGRKTVRVHGNTRGGSRVIELPERFFDPNQRLLPERGSESFFDTNMSRIERVMEAKAAFEAEGARIAKEQNFAWRRFSRWADDLKREMDRLESDMRNPAKFQALQEQLRALETGEAPSGVWVLKGLFDDAPRSVLSENATMKLVMGEVAGRKKGATVEYTISGLADAIEVKKAKMALYYLERKYPKIMNLWRRSIEKNPKFEVKFVSASEMMMRTGARGVLGNLMFKGTTPTQINISMGTMFNRALSIKEYVDTITHEFWHNRDLLKFDYVSQLQENMPRGRFSKFSPIESRARGAGETAATTFGSKIAEAKWDILDGLLEAQQGIKELLGAERLGITPQMFSFDSYNRARPHFRKAWESWQKAGANVNSYVEMMVKNYGENVRPYVEKFLEDEGLVPLPRGAGTSGRVENPGLNIQKELDPDAVGTSKGAYKPPKPDVTRLGEWFRMSEQRLRNNPDAQRLMADVIEAQLKASHDTHVVDAALIDDVLTLKQRKVGPDKKMTKESQLGLRPAMEELYRLAKENPREADRKIGSDPVYAKASKIINWFEHFRGEVVRYKRELFEAQMPKTKWEIFKNIEQKYGSMSVKEILSKKGEIIKEYAARAKSRNIKTDELFNEFKEYQNIKGWGIDDFITNIEVGMYRVLDADGKVRAVGRTRKIAERRRQELLQDNPDAKLTVSAEFQKPLDPTKKRENVLRGEENIIDAMRAYSAVMRKKIALEPVEARIERAFTADEGGVLYPKNTREAIRNSLREAKGQYSVGDELLDIVQKGFTMKTGDRTIEFEGLGGEPMTWSRIVSRARAFEGYTKLGYRPVAGLVNWGSGHLHTWVKVGAKYMARGKRWANTPEGRRTLLEEEPYLGLDFAHAETSGKLKTKQGLLHPLKTFSWAEPGIRKQAYAANFVYGKDVLGLSDAAARLHARRGVRVQSFVYNTAALPRIMRGPTGKLATQFKSYLANEMEFIASLRGREIARYLGMHLMLAGPRGLVLMARSIPILGVVGAWDKIDEWLLTTEIPENTPVVGGKTPFSGVMGLADADITAPATFQFVSDNPIEFMAGPFLTDFVLRLGKDVVGPALKGEKFVQDKAVDWMSTLLVAGKYWADLIESEVSEDGWVREGLSIRMEDGKPTGYSVGRKMFKVDSWYDQFLLLNGIPSISRTRMQNLQRILRREQDVNRANASAIYKKLANGLQAGNHVDADVVQMAAMLGLIDTMENVERLMMIREMDPKTRAAQLAAVREKARVLEILPDVE